MTAPQEEQLTQQTPLPEESQANKTDHPQPVSASSKKRKSGWRYKKPPDLSLAQETTFLNMQLRKTSRALSGAKQRNTNYEFFALAVLLVVIYSAGAYVRDDNNDPQSQYLVTLTLGQVVAIGIWMFLAAFVTATFADSRFLELLTWMFIYLPLLAIVTSFVFDTEKAVQGELNYFSYGQVVGIVLLAAEILAVAVFVCIFYLYPKIINSDRFRRNRRAAHFWKIKTVGDWTMTYLSAKKVLKDRHTCKYQGETNEDGLPHGIGRWFDDSTDGEILTGTWKNGIPVAPFVSRHYGRGDLFSAVRVAYVMASDDDFSTSKFWPTADDAPRCGIGSVECSVAGLFYNELPCAAMLQDEVPFDENTSLEALIKDLRYMGEVDDEMDDNHRTTLTIKANDPRGVQIPGLVHAHTGKTFNKVDEILVKVEPVGNATKQAFQRRAKGMEYMPSSKRGSVFGEEIIAVRTDDDDEKIKEESDNVAPVAMATIAESNATDKDDTIEVGFPDAQTDASKTHSEVKLTIENWRPAKNKDALIFFPGFNCPLKEALQGFGQFIAMTKLDAEIYPILYSWPCGQVLSYHSASRASHRQENKKNLLALFKSLQHAGIRTVHLMSHSMGVQSLVGAFCDNEDGSRSDISKCFRQAQGWLDNDTQNCSEDDDENLLVCKTLTMLNPDWPLESFVNHAFRSIRRVCATITVVGDRTDFALLMSQVVNGIGVYFGYQQPREFMPNTRNKKSLCGQMVVGKHIDQLYLPEDQEDDDNLTRSESLVFKERAPMTIVAAEDDLDRSWLDIDVIDTSGLDTNIAGIRHSAFNLNPILLNDLEELIKTNNRAMKRSSLLYRDGNIFSYCHAPSYVSY